MEIEKGNASRGLPDAVWLRMEPPIPGRKSHIGRLRSVNLKRITVYFYFGQRTNTSQICSGGAKRMEKQDGLEYRARRRVVEVCHSCLNRFRRILARFENKLTRLSIPPAVASPVSSYQPVAN